ncbi:uncharacterized protein [Musca autumnalis]|uniref:uncharacterized protein n=1 Tax=Musca autumnalis TaxID=221902 RepID=UPI003CF25E93
MGRRNSNKQRKSNAEEKNPTPSSMTTENYRKRIFLYLQPKTIFYPLDEEEGNVEENVTSVEIELTHQYNAITKLSDHYTIDNTIHLDEFAMGEEKPTFSITINQDDIDNVNNCFITLTLYENISRPFWPDVGSEEESIGDSVHRLDKQQYENVSLEEAGETEESNTLYIIEHRPVAQGYIDLLDFFSKTRIRSSCTVFLYPLNTSNHRLTCKMEWEIYSLHPLVKDMTLSNVLFITLASIYNVDGELFESSCEDLMAKFSLFATRPNEMMEVDKIPLCSFRGFSKQLIKDQVLDIKWENLKDARFQNEQTMAIMAESKINPQKLFYELLTNENSDVHFEDIDCDQDSAWICNSMYRYVLTDVMERQIEDVLAFDSYRILLELVRESEPDLVMLQGFINPAVFMYPQVHNCSFAVELRPPGYKKPTLPIPKDPIPKNLKNHNKKGKRKGSQSTVETSRRSTMQSNNTTVKEKVPFAIVKMCLQKPITEPKENMIHVPKSEIKSSKFVRCPRKTKNSQQIVEQNIKDICEETYRSFDETILDMADYILRNNIKTIGDDKRFYCSQLGNLSNKMLRLIACDFNRRVPTQTNIEFENLMTMVYQELSDRIYNIIMQCSSKGTEKCLYAGDEIQRELIFKFNICKYMFEVENFELVDHLKAKLVEKYANNPLLNFYGFLWDIECENFNSVWEYLKKPLKEKYIAGEHFEKTIELYITYIQELEENETSRNAKENLIYSLAQNCERDPPNISSWILLYCLYKDGHYLPGMEYCRWKYENLYNCEFIDIPPAPKSRWEIYLPHEIQFKALKDQHFYKVVKLFTKLGLYKFAEIIFNEIALESLDFERYMMTSTFGIMLHQLEKKYNVKNYPVEKYMNPNYLRATLSQVNGNIEFYRNGSADFAIKHYSQIIDVKDLQKYDPFNLGILRYGYQMMKAKEYNKAKEAFSLCCSTGEENGNCVVASIGRGKACYKLDELDDAEEAFAQSTQYGIYLPNVWAYLALINLKKGENYKALECWKYARLDPAENIHPEILDELEKINHKDINLYIDIPELRKT